MSPATAELPASRCSSIPALPAPPATSWGSTDEWPRARAAKPRWIRSASSAPPRRDDRDPLRCARTGWRPAWRRTALAAIVGNVSGTDGRDRV